MNLHAIHKLKNIFRLEIMMQFFLSQYGFTLAWPYTFIRLPICLSNVNASYVMFCIGTPLLETSSLCGHSSHCVYDIYLVHVNSVV